MNVQFLIGCYAVICLSIITYNCYCVLLFRYKDQSREKNKAVIYEYLKEDGQLADRDRRDLRKRLEKIDALLAFDEVLEELKKTDESHFEACRKSTSGIIRELVKVYSGRNIMQQACFAYVLCSSGAVRYSSSDEMFSFLLGLTRNSNIYCRENAMRALYSSSRTESVLKGLEIINGSDIYYNPKLITEGLLSFSGDKELLIGRIWTVIDRMKPEMRVALLNFIRFASGRWGERMLELIKSSPDTEERIAALRYFGKYPDISVFPVIKDLLGTEQWEINAVIMTVLASYPGEETISILKEGLCSRNWYVRNNAAESIYRLYPDYDSVRDVLEGQDPYARQALKFRFEKAAMEKRGDEERRVKND